MRAPRYRFPEEVRSATRVMAERMVQQGTITQTPEELDRWVTEHPDVREPLEEGGYGQAFGAGDLLPLLHVFVAQAGGPAPEAEAPPPSSNRKWLVAMVVGVALLGIAVALGVLAWQ